MSVIDTSKAVRPCVEELAGQVNTNLMAPFNVLPDTFHYNTWEPYVKQGTFTQCGITCVNNGDGTFTLNPGNKTSGIIQFSAQSTPMREIGETFYSRLSASSTVVYLVPFAACLLMPYKDLIPELPLTISVTYDIYQNDAFLQTRTTGWTYSAINPINLKYLTYQIPDQTARNYSIKNIRAQFFINAGAFTLENPFDICFTTMCDASVLLNKSVADIYKSSQHSSTTDVVLSKYPSLISDINNAHFEDALRTQYPNFTVEQNTGGLKLYSFS